MKLLRYIALFFVSLLLATPPAGAFEFCRCTQNFTPADAWGTAAAVFSGKVVKIEDFNTKNIRVYFEVNSSWKGPASKELKIFTHRSDALGFIRFGISCGYPFELNQQYLVYATTEKLSPLTVDHCLRTQPLSEATEDLEVLGPPEVIFTENGPVRRTLPNNGGAQ